MSIFYSLFFTFLLFIFSFKLNAQQEKNNTKFKIHKVEKGQSLYAIAKLYQIELSAIVMENPDAIDGIKAGQELKIPIANPKKETEKKEDKKLNTDGIHKVVKGETIYSICKKYNLSQPQLISLNPSLKEFGLKEGQLLQVKLITPEKSQTVQETKVETKVSKTELLESKIRPEIYQVKEEDDLATILSSSSMTETEFYNLNPEARQGIKKNQLIKIIRKKENETDNKNKIETALIENETEINPTIIIDTTTFIKKNNYTIGLMLPFKFNETDALDLRKMEEEKQNFPEQQSLAIDFYEGINYALHLHWAGL